MWKTIIMQDLDSYHIIYIDFYAIRIKLQIFQYYNMITFLWGC